MLVELKDICIEDSNRLLEVGVGEEGFTKNLKTDQRFGDLSKCQLP